MNRSPRLTGRLRGQKNTAQHSYYFVFIGTDPVDASIPLQSVAAVRSDRHLPILSAPNAETRRLRKRLFATVWYLFAGTIAPACRPGMDLGASRQRWRSRNGAPPARRTQTSIARFSSRDLHDHVDRIRACAAATGEPGLDRDRVQPGRLLPGRSNM